MKTCAIIGSGDLGQQIAYHVTQNHQYDVAGYFNDFISRGDVVGQFPILGGQDDILPCFDAGAFDVLFIGVGYAHLDFRAAMYDKFEGRIPYGRMIHPSAYVDPSCSVGEGAVIFPGGVLDMNTVLEPNVLLNTGVHIAHDSTIGKHSFLSPAVAVAGFVNIGSCCNIGINTTIIDNIQIASNVQTGGGTTVIRHLTKPGLYVGTPARLVR